MNLKELISTSWFIPLCLMILFIGIAYIKFTFFYSEKNEYEDGEDHTRPSPPLKETDENKELFDIIQKLEAYLNDSKNNINGADTNSGEIRTNLTNYSSANPFVVDYPSLYIPHYDKKAVASFSIISDVQDLINENASDRASDRFNDYLIPYLKINIPQKQNNQFMIAHKTPDLLQLIFSEQNKYQFDDRGLDKLYFLEPKSENIPDNTSKLIKDQLKKLPFFHSIYYTKNISISLPFESIDFNNPNQIKEIYEILLEIYKIVG